MISLRTWLAVIPAFLAADIATGSENPGRKRLALEAWRQLRQELPANLEGLQKKWKLKSVREDEVLGRTVAVFVRIESRWPEDERIVVWKSQPTTK